MALYFGNQRGDLPPQPIKPSAYITRLLYTNHNRNRQHCTSLLSLPPNPKPNNSHDNGNPCYDWIFSSASNVHIAIDRSTFKTYTPFKSYVLAVADHRRILVKGIGSVDLGLRCKKGSRQCHTITLENVLHVPSWMCNIFSDVYFENVGHAEFEHTWGREGVQFMRRKEAKWRSWGFTEGFCGLEKLVLSKPVMGRSPMLDDPQREVFSVNVNWPMGQMDRWDGLVERLERRNHKDDDVRLVEKDGNVGKRSQSAPTLKA